MCIKALHVSSVLKKQFSAITEMYKKNVSRNCYGYILPETGLLRVPDRLPHVLSEYPRAAIMSSARRTVLKALLCE